MKRKTKALIFNIALPLIVGGVSAYISRDGMESFKALEQPPLSPPAALFPIVWTILYILMGIASYLVSTADTEPHDADNALTIYAVQLGFNFFWSLFFFKLGWFYFAFIWLLMLWVLIILTIRAFGRTSKTAARLLVPYVIWVTFAAYLNLGTALLN